MKKSLMILASVALGASMASAADVTSKNVVGFYEISTTASKWLQSALQFDKVGGATNTLADLPIDPAKWNGSVLQVAYYSGSLLKFRVYTCYSEDPNGTDPEEGGGGPAGWYDGTFTYAGGVKIPAGTGFWLVPSITTNTTFSGEVVADDISVTFASGKWQMLCNPYPVDMKLSELPFSPASWGGTALQVAYYSGNLLKYRVYTCYAEDPNGPDPEEGGGGPAGWYDGTFTYSGNVVLPIGQGFWINPVANSGTVTFQSPL